MCVTCDARLAGRTLLLRLRRFMSLEGFALTVGEGGGASCFDCATGTIATADEGEAGNEMVCLLILLLGDENMPGLIVDSADRIVRTLSGGVFTIVVAK